MQKTLGGERLGSGKKMKVDLHGYERSTHDMGYLWRSTMSAGTLVPFLCEVALPGDTFDIELDCDIKTHPTVGPLFGSYKVQLDLFQAPIRLYQGQLHNNALGIGMNMANVKLPFFTLLADGGINPATQTDPDNFQINPSCILSYLGIRGIGNTIEKEVDTQVTRNFNAVPLLMYWDTIKNYYINKMEDQAYVIHTAITEVFTDITTVKIGLPGGFTTIPETPALISSTRPGTVEVFEITYGSAPGLTAEQLLAQIIINTNQGSFAANSIVTNPSLAGLVLTGYWRPNGISYTIINYSFIDQADQSLIVPPVLQEFPIDEFDTMRNEILAFSTAGATAFNVGNQDLPPYNFLLNDIDGATTYKFTQEGLGVKTYQSDLFNNWLSEEMVTNGITDITAIDTTGGSFTIDTFLMAKKVYDMMNRVVAAGGSYDDWREVMWDHESFSRPETPVYEGSLIREIVFQEVISNSATEGETNIQPLGTLGGRGILGNKKKGGKIIIKIDEPSYIMGIISITPRIDYSQGNKWDVHLLTMDDLHKPALDQIGFQDLITEQMHWADTYWDETANAWVQNSAGKQPAWMNYMTNTNQVRGNFAVQSNEMFMTLNRRYELNPTTGRIQDLTTYIDPAKFNNSFAQTALDAQNFWAQIAVDMTARRKISAKIIPNL